MHRDEIRALLREQTPGSSPEETEVAAIQSALSLLKSLPEIEPSPETWKRIESQLSSPSFAHADQGNSGATEGKPSRRPAALKYRWQMAAAASILVAVASFGVVMHATRTGALPVVVETGKALNSWSDRYTAERFTTLLIPDVGTLKLNKNATLRFEHPRCVILESGEVFAEIIPSGKGFQIRSGESTVQV